MGTELAVIEKMDQLSTALSKYTPEEHNLLLPTTELHFIAPEHKIVINTVQLDPEEDFYPQDVKYYQQGGQWQSNVQSYSLSKRGLRRLMHIAGATVKDSNVRFDGEGRAHAKATITLTTPDGLSREFTQNYTWDTVARVEEAERKFQDDVEKNPRNEAKLRRKFENERSRIIKYAASLAETGAINRALRDALTTKSKYTPEEIKKPFVCLHVIEPPRPEIDFDHPFIKRLISLAMLNGEELPTPHPTPTVQLLKDDGIDPMSDAVAAGEVDYEDHESEADFSEGAPPIIEELFADDEEPDNGEPELVTEAELKAHIVEALPEAEPKEVDEIAAYYLNLAGNDPTDALTRFEKAKAKKRS